MTRLMLIGLGCAALAACGQRPEREAPAQRDMSTADVAAPATESMAAGRAPGIDVTAAPGVALTYRYGFRLPADGIDNVQEGHAQACEQLGPARCRITGMRYRLLGENNIEAALDFKLDPALARGFGKEGIAAVERATGTLVDAEITGTDTLPMTDRAGVDRARAQDEIRRLDAQLAAARTAAERAELQAQRADAARRIAAAADTAGAARDSLASTPVLFRYESGPAVRGFDTSAPFTSAINTGIASVETTLAVVLALLAIFGPPALVLGLVIWAVIALRRRLRAQRPAAAIGTAAPPPAD